MHALGACYRYTKESNLSSPYITYLVGELRLELRTSASKTDVLTNYTAFPNEMVIHYIKVITTKNLNHITNGKSILTYRSEWKSDLKYWKYEMFKISLNLTFQQEDLLGHPGTIRDCNFIRVVALPISWCPNEMPSSSFWNNGLGSDLLNDLLTFPLRLDYYQIRPCSP